MTAQRQITYEDVYLGCWKAVSLVSQEILWKLSCIISQVSWTSMKSQPMRMRDNLLCEFSKLEIRVYGMHYEAE